MAVAKGQPLAGLHCTQVSMYLADIQILLMSTGSRLNIGVLINALHLISRIQILIHVDKSIVMWMPIKALVAIVIIFISLVMLDIILIEEMGATEVVAREEISQEIVEI